METHNVHTMPKFIDDNEFLCSITECIYIYESDKVFYECNKSEFIDFEFALRPRFTSEQLSGK